MVKVLTNTTAPTYIISKHEIFSKFYFKNLFNIVCIVERAACLCGPQIRVGRFTLWRKVGRRKGLGGVGVGSLLAVTSSHVGSNTSTPRDGGCYLKS